MLVYIHCLQGSECFWPAEGCLGDSGYQEMFENERKAGRATPAGSLPGLPPTHQDSPGSLLGYTGDLT